MQIYFHRHLFSHLSRVPILVEGTVITMTQEKPCHVSEICMVLPQRLKLIVWIPLKISEQLDAFPQFIPLQIEFSQV